MQTFWNITDSKRITSTGLITEVSYKVTVFNGEIFETSFGKVQLTGNTNSEDFIPFENLNESTLIDWVKSKLGSKSTDIENKLSKEVEFRTKEFFKKQNSKISNGLPWVNKK
jgi:hypothetical protein